MSASNKERSQEVLYVTYNCAPKLGGLEQVVQRTRDALQQEAQVLTLAQGAQGYQDSDTTVLRPSREGLLPFMGFLYTRGMWGLGRRRFHTVVAGSALSALPTLHLARRYGARSVAIIYGLDTIYPSRTYQLAYRYAMSRMDLVIAISEATRAEAIKRGVDPNRIVIIPPGCDAERFLQPRVTDELCERWGLADHKVILSAGRLVQRKGLDRFIRECLPRVVKAVPQVKLLVAGGNPEGALAHTDDVLSNVLRATKESHMSDHVIITGRLSSEEMISAFQLSDVFILPVVPTPGDMEGFGIVLLEAGAASKPVVATASGGVTDAVVNNVTGTLVEPYAYADMSKAITEFLINEQRNNEFGQRGRERALHEFNWDRISRRYVAAILDKSEQESV